MVRKKIFNHEGHEKHEEEIKEYLLMNLGFWGIVLSGIEFSLIFSQFKVQ